MTRESFLARVRRAAAAGKAHRVHLPPLDPDAGYVGAGEDLCLALAREIEAVGGQAQIVQDHAQAGEALRQLVIQRQVRSAICWKHPVLERVGVSGLLQQQGVQRIDFDALRRMPEEERRKALLSAELGVTSVDGAVAETGSLMLRARPGQERLASLLPPAHVALVEATQIVPDLLDAFQRLSEPSQQLPSNITFVTGPSKTGDIELQLTTGVHGPGLWQVIVIRQDSASASG